MNNSKIFYLFLRYFFVLLIALFIFLFPLVLTAPTALSVNFLLTLTGESHLINNVIVYNGVGIELIPACIASSAYILLFLLLFSVQMKAKDRIKALVFSIFLFFIFNVFRITLLSIIIKSPVFEILHMFLWYFLSTLAVFLIWILDVKMFNISNIPVYSDFKDLLSLAKNRKKLKKSKRKSKNYKSSH